MLLHQTVASRVRTAIGVDIVHLGVPSPNFSANERSLYRRGTCFRKRRGFDVGDDRFLQVRQSGLRGNECLGDARRGNPPTANRSAETEEENCAYDQEQNDLCARLQPMPRWWCRDFIVKHLNFSSTYELLNQIAVIVFLIRGYSRGLVWHATRHRGHGCRQELLLKLGQLLDSLVVDGPSFQVHIGH